MKINRLVLKDFRSYALADYTFSQACNVLVGQNAQGKTNLIEAIYLLSLAKSFRTRYNMEMIRFDQPYAKILGEITTKTSRKHLEVVLFDKGKQAKINHVVCSKTSAFVGTFNVVVFTPDDLFFVKGSPKIRRRFMNIELSKISSAYLVYLNQFQHFLKERNQYLKKAAATQKKDPLYLEVVTAQMIECEIELARRRSAFIAKLADYTEKIYRRMTRADERISLVYETFFNYEDVCCQEQLVALYKEDEAKDYRYGKTSHAINKDDIQVRINDKPASQFASQGQQRSIVLAMKIALLRWIKEEIGEYPVLLLDDVLSELDTERQNLLLSLLDNQIQTFITTTTLAGLSHEVIAKAKKFEIVKERSYENG